MSTPQVRFDHVSKRFRRGERHDSLRDLIPALVKRCVRGAPAEVESEQDFWALSDVSFEVHAGEALGIIGRNGAGKSTILKLLSRILRPTRGECAVTGRLGALIEVAAGFHPDLTGRENIYLQGAIMGMRRAEIARHFDEIVEFAGVERFVDTQVKRYSSGMNARLGFSIAAHLHPDVLLIDEVLAVGDMAFQEKCQTRMKRFLDDGAAIVFVSHHLAAVAQLCTKVMLLERGVMVQLGAPAAVISHYCNGGSTADFDDVVIAATLRTGPSASAADSSEVQPGDRLSLDVRVQFKVDVERAVLGVVVWDMRRELYVYGASSESIGMRPIAAAAGQIRTFNFTFDANLTRGLYAIEVNIIDPDRHRFLGIARGIRHFRVVEDISYDGIANLFLAGREGAGLRGLRDVRTAAGRGAI
jgi:lipopolysaccharide transport system ATP-binding protein